MSDMPYFGHVGLPPGKKRSKTQFSRYPKRAVSGPKSSAFGDKYFAFGDKKFSVRGQIFRLRGQNNRQGATHPGPEMSPPRAKKNNIGTQKFNGMLNH